MNGPALSPDNPDSAPKRRWRFLQPVAMTLFVIFLNCIVIWPLWGPASRLLNDYILKVQGVDRKVMAPHSSGPNDTHTMNSRFNAWTTTPYRRQPQQNSGDNLNRGTEQGHESRALPKPEVESSTPAGQE